MRKKTFWLSLGISLLFFYFFCQAADNKHNNTDELLKQTIEFLEFREVDIKDVLRQLARQYNLNIVFSEAVSGNITIQLHNISLAEALDAIITVNGFDYIRKDRVIKVVTPEEVEREGKVTKLFMLNNADAQQLKTALSKIVSEDGSIEVEKRVNALIITDTAEIINKIEQMIPQLDRLTPQVLIEARFIETSIGITEKLGIDWNLTATASGSKRPTTFPFKKWGSDKDMYPVPEYTTTYDSDTGNYTVDSSFPFIGEPVFFPNGNYQLGSFPAVGADNFTFGTLNFTQLQAVLDFIKTDSKSRILSAPRVVTMDNKEARIQVGETRRIRTEEEYNEETNQRTYTYEPVDVGVILTVTPHVTNNGNIILKLKPEVSSVTGFEPDSLLQIIGKRVAETEVVIKNGETLVIGGLMKNQTTDTVTKVPILGEIPILNMLFKHKQKDPNEKVELLIFVTANIIEPGNKKYLPQLHSEQEMAYSKPFKLNLRKLVNK